MYKVGDKVVPLTKTVRGWGGLDTSENWKMAIEREQPYLYVTGYDEDDENVLLLNSRKNHLNMGDFFNPEDVIPYEIDWDIQFREEENLHEWQEAHITDQLGIRLFKYKERAVDKNYGYQFRIHCWGEDLEKLQDYRPQKTSDLDMDEVDGIVYQIRLHDFDEAIELVNEIKEYYHSAL